ncbi:helix-turn-helix domain-containing protein [Streptomyces carpinensis]|uniref:Helix-turn-helix domain-containing protein n=1 Tax=Streptomyces carpinensis TaxID=66369 RepID=A0ABV1W0A9_9ACTN|nr:helix-turn-helix domain-containing protein [Streptomyces carpinensis]
MLSRACSTATDLVITARIARETGLHLDTVRTWRNRFAGNRLAALSDRKRSGRPATARRTVLPPERRGRDAAPSAGRARTVVNPCPDATPVTITVFPRSPVSVSSSLALRRHSP